MTNPTDKELLAAIARGWCAKENAHKEVDADLASAIAVEVSALFAAHALRSATATRSGATAQQEAVAMKPCRDSDPYYGSQYSVAVLAWGSEGDTPFPALVRWDYDNDGWVSADLREGPSPANYEDYGFEEIAEWSYALRRTAPPAAPGVEAE